MNKPVFTLAAVASALLTVSMVYPSQQDYQSQRKTIIDEMQQTIQTQVDAGQYRCCIQPACDMCFLGHWLWDDGVCRCDDMIAQGEFDKVCPQCKAKVDDGSCSSAETDVPVCEIP